MLNVDTDSLAFNGHCQQCNWTSLGFCIDNSQKTFQKKVTKIKNIALSSFHLGCFGIETSTYKRKAAFFVNRRSSFSLLLSSGDFSIGMRY